MEGVHVGVHQKLIAEYVRPIPITYQYSPKMHVTAQKWADGVSAPASGGLQRVWALICIFLPANRCLAVDRRFLCVVLGMYGLFHLYIGAVLRLNRLIQHMMYGVGRIRLNCITWTSNHRQDLVYVSKIRC